MNSVSLLSEKFVTVQEFVDYMNGGVSHSGIYKKIRNGIIPAVKIGSKTYIPKSWIYNNYDKRIEATLAKVAE